MSRTIFLSFGVAALLALPGFATLSSAAQFCNCNTNAQCPSGYYCRGGAFCGAAQGHKGRCWPKPSGAGAVLDAPLKSSGTPLPNTPKTTGPQGVAATQKNAVPASGMADMASSRLKRGK
jgi:hypothetical protein